MYNIAVRLREDNWSAEVYLIEEPCILTVHIIAFEDVRNRSTKVVKSFLPLGDMEYLIWGQDNCLGLLTISELAQTGQAPDSDGGT